MQYICVKLEHDDELPVSAIKIKRLFFGKSVIIAHHDRQQTTHMGPDNTEINCV